MKKIIVFLFLFISYLNLYAQTGCCPPPDDILPCYNNDVFCQHTLNTWQSGERHIILPNHPYCIVVLKYCWRDCQNDNYHYVQNYICSRDIHQRLCTPCDLVDYLSPEDLELYNDRNKELDEELITELTKLNFYDFYNSKTPEEQENYRCPTDPGGNGEPDWTNVRYKVSFFKGACSSYCSGLYHDGEEKIMETSETSCAPEYCCKLTIQYCIDDTGHLWMLKTYDDGGAVPDCPGITPPPCSSQYEERIQGPCQSNCSN